MRNLFFLLLVACGGSSPPPPAPPIATNQAPAIREEPVDVVATRFATAALHGNTDEVNRIALTFDEIAEITTRADDRDDWNKMIERVRRRFAEVGARDHLEVQRAEIVKRETVQPDHKVRRAIEAAVVRVYLAAPDGSTRKEHLVFLHTPGGWRYSPKG
jgi:hypothetical protein